MPQMTHDEALFWLNDYCDEWATLSIELDRDEIGTTVLEIEGVLSHWRAESDLVGDRHDMRGLYTVGDHRFDVTALESVPIIASDIGDGITFELGAGVRLVIVGEEPDPEPLSPG